MLARHRLPVLVAGCLAIFATILPTVPAGAAGTDYVLPGNWLIRSATTKCPGAAAKTLTGIHAAAFIEAWYPASIFGTLTEEKPPAALPVCTFFATTVIRVPKTASNGDVTYVNGIFHFKGLLATQGTKGWVGLPPQEVGPGAVVPKLRWYVATPRVIGAFNGKVEPVKQPPVTTSTTTPATAAESSSSDNSAVPWIIAGVAVVALLGVGGLVLSRRRAAA
jgi:MYXO-CTERM domain-containing protein